MALRPEPFTGSGQIITPANANVDTDIKGLAFVGFTSVAVYDGPDNTGTLVLYLANPGTMPLNEGVVCERGVYVECAGVGKGSVWM